MRERISEHLSLVEKYECVDGILQVLLYKFRNGTSRKLLPNFSQNDIESQDHRNAIQVSREGNLRVFPLPSRVYVRAKTCFNLSQTPIALESKIIRMFRLLISDRCPEELLPLLSQATAQEVSHCERTAS